MCQKFTLAHLEDMLRGKGGQRASDGTHAVLGVWHALSNGQCGAF